MLGTEVGSYRITEKLGEGGMGAVYFAEHKLLGKKAAVKLLLPELSKNEEVVQRFFNEAKAATMIHHAGIIEVFDFGYTDRGEAFIVMELLRGESLTERIAAFGRLPEAELLGLTRQAANALSAAHAAKIVHRDLKPDNIFLCPDPEVVGGERVKVLDFGIAKLTSDAMVGAQRTRTGSIMGSPAYMSPEQCRGLSTVDLRADVYSLGCVMYQMATGRLPFSGEGVGDVIAKHIYEEPPKPQSWNADVSDALEAVILRCLSKEPEDRFQDMDALVVAVDAAAGVAVSVAPSVSRVSSNAHAATALASGPSVHTTLGGAASEVHVQPVEPRRRAPLLAGLGLVVAAAVVGAVIVTGDGPAQEAEPMVAASGTTETKPAAPAPAESVSFRIVSRPPGADVFRLPSETRVGATPFEQEEPAVRGEAIFLVKRAGYVSERVVLDSAVGGSKTVTLVATPVEPVAAAASSEPEKPRSKKAPRQRRPKKTKPERGNSGSKNTGETKPSAAPTDLWAD